MPLDPFQRQDPASVAGRTGPDHRHRGDLLTQRREHLRLPAKGLEGDGQFRPGGLEETLATVLEKHATGIRPGEPGGDRRGSPDDG